MVNMGESLGLTSKKSLLKITNAKPEFKVGTGTAPTLSCPPHLHLCSPPTPTCVPHPPPPAPSPCLPRPPACPSSLTGSQSFSIPRCPRHLWGWEAQDRVLGLKVLYSDSLSSPGTCGSAERSHRPCSSLLPLLLSSSCSVMELN